MTQAFTSAGSRLHVSETLPATFDKAGYEALTWTEIGEVTNMGEFGRKYNWVNYNPINSRQVQKRKGSYDEGELPLELARIPDDVGQAILLTARDSDNSYAFRVTLNDDQGSGIGHHPTYQYFCAQVGSYTTNIGGVDSITAATCNVAITKPVIEDPRSDGT